MAVETNKIEELLKILEEQGRTTEKQQITLLLDEMRDMKQNYVSVEQELKDIKGQLNILQGMLMNHGIYHNQMESDLAVRFEKMNEVPHQSLKNIQESLNEKAGQVIENFKAFGTKALNKVCEFLRIEEHLTKLKDSMQSRAVAMHESIEKLGKIEFEMGNASLHAKNVGRTIAGKETLDPADRKENKFFKNLESKLQSMESFYMKMSDKLGNAINRFEDLARAAGKRAEKPSVIKQLQDYKEQTKLLPQKANVKEKAAELEA